MRAAVLREYNAPLSIEDVPMPECPKDGVLLKVLACGVCRSDWHGWVGKHPAVKPGQIGGHEYCGEVVEAGPRSNWAVGDKLIAPFILACGTCPSCQSGAQNTCPDQRLPGFKQPGAFAQYIAVPFDHNLTRLPEDMSATVAAGLGCRVTTAWHGLTGRAGLQTGEWLSVHGTGGVGLSGLLLGQALGARVICVDVVPEKLAHAKSLGAEHVIDAREGDVGARIKDLTGGGAHVALEALGVPATVNGALEGLRPLGRHVQLGMPSGEDGFMPVNMRAVYMGNLAIFASRGMPSWRYPSLLDLITRGKVDMSPLIAREIPLSKTSEELAAFNGPAAPGVAVITDFTR